ncbi:hypothetical protein GRJ2_000022800 [Grus japonensis]|uniref:RNase H type-1 domain-containing protein n=1 Tax=Grus japonensis TaxID=30415 RepID=A0ABC9VRC2_GRUJA
MLKTPLCTINCGKLRSNMTCLPMDPVILWESIGGGRLLYGVLHDELQKLLKDKVNRTSLQKAIQLALDIAEREKWLMLYLYIDSWMVANALWGWLQQWKRSNWQRRGKPIWAAELWQDITAWLEKLVVKVRHVDAHIPKSQATEEHRNNEQVDQASRTEVAQVDLDWEHKGELFIAQWAHDTSGHLGRDVTYKWACDQEVDLTIDAIAQVIRECQKHRNQTS